MIGGGAIGVASAYYLGRSGWQVTVVDSGEIGRGCSYGNSGLITPSHSHPLPGPGVVRQAIHWMLQRDSPFYVRPRLDPAFLSWGWRFRRYCSSEASEQGFQALLRLGRASLQLYDELAQTHSLDFFYQNKGLLHVYQSRKGAEGARREQETLEASGFTTQLLSRQETIDFEPALNDRVQAGLFIEGDAHGHCYDYVQCMASEVRGLGGSFLTQRAVSSITVERGRVTRVLTASPEEEIPADLVVLAAGSWTSSLAAPLGIRIPLQPAKGYSCTIDSYPGSPKVPFLLPENRVIVTPFAERLRFGGTLELAGFDLSLNERRYKAVVRGGREVLKEPVPMKNEESWCGLRPLLPDGLPIIDRARHTDGLIVATGHAMLGFTHSPITGKLVAELANDQTPSVSLAPFRLDRF